MMLRLSYYNQRELSTFHKVPIYTNQSCNIFVCFRKYLNATWLLFELTISYQRRRKRLLREVSTEDHITEPILGKNSVFEFIIKSKRKRNIFER